MFDNAKQAEPWSRHNLLPAFWQSLAKVPQAWQQRSWQTLTQKCQKCHRVI